MGGKGRISINQQMDFADCDFELHQNKSYGGMTVLRAVIDYNGMPGNKVKNINVSDNHYFRKAQHGGPRGYTVRGKTWYKENVGGITSQKYTNWIQVPDEMNETLEKLIKECASRKPRAPEKKGGSKVDSIMVD